MTDIIEGVVWNGPPPADTVRCEAVIYAVDGTIAQAVIRLPDGTAVEVNAADVDAWFAAKVNAATFRLSHDGSTRRSSDEWPRFTRHNTPHTMDALLAATLANPAWRYTGT